MGYCCRCGHDEEDLELTEVNVHKLAGQAPSEPKGGSFSVPSSIADLDELIHPVQEVTEATEWQPPPEHRAVFEADLCRRQTATQLLEGFRQMVDVEIFSSEPTPLQATELQARHFCSDDTLVRHLMFCDGDEKKALASLIATLRWRADFLEGKGIAKVGEGVASKKSCNCCMKDPRAHCFLCVGTDAAGHHVIYSCAGAAINKKPIDGCRHMALELERIFDGNSLPGRVVWIVNMAGFSIADCNPQTPMMALPMFFNHYPERFAQIIMWGMPTIFLGTWPIVQSLMDPINKARALIQRTDAERMRYAEAYWSNNVEMSAWLNAAKRVKGVPGDFPDISLSRRLSSEDARTVLERCAALKRK